ncbi:hypothetical protein EV359DRAFT_86538 [Lentinula novae-zelandiae]|nr:hypothetical protein EV359DRAFT_86538 [Lentinula novae-zelandiae]
MSLSSSRKEGIPKSVSAREKKFGVVNLGWRSSVGSEIERMLRVQISRERVTISSKPPATATAPPTGSTSQSSPSRSSRRWAVSISSQLSAALSAISELTGPFNLLLRSSLDNTISIFPTSARLRSTLDVTIAPRSVWLWTLLQGPHLTLFFRHAKPVESVEYIISLIQGLEGKDGVARGSNNGFIGDETVKFKLSSSTSRLERGVVPDAY